MEDPQPQGLHLRNQKTCPNKRGHLWITYGQSVACSNVVQQAWNRVVHEQQDGKNVLLPHSPYRVKFELAVYGSNFSNIERKALGCLVVPNPFRS